MPSLKHKTISGIKWTFAASIVQRVISFGTTVVLARILSPADFGLFALAFVMIDGFGIFKSLGFDSALVRRKDVDIEKACNTAFFLIPAMGMILFVILFFFAPFGAKFLNNPQVAPLIRALAIIFVISTFGKVPQTVLYREMKFKYKSIAEVSAAIVYSATALILALHGFGVWSLVAGYIIKTLTQISIEWYFSGWKPKFEFDKSIAWDMFHFGKYVLLGSLINFLFNNLDNIVVGKLLGVTILGYYAISINLTNSLSQYLLSKVAMIMYPAYSHLQNNSEDIKKVVLKTTRYLSILVFPFGLSLVVFSSEIVRVVFGSKWLPAAGILSLLGFAGIFRSLGTAIWPAFLARGKSKIDFLVNAIQVVVFFILVFPLVKTLKLNGVGIATLAAYATALCATIIRANRYFSIRSSDFFYAVKPALVSSAIAFSLGFLLKALFESSMKHDVFSIIISLILYCIVLHVFDRDIWSSLIKFLFSNER